MTAQELAPEIAPEDTTISHDDGLPLPTAEMDGDALFRLGMQYSAGSGGCPMGP